MNAWDNAGSSRSDWLSLKEGLGNLEVDGWRQFHPGVHHSIYLFSRWGNLATLQLLHVPFGNSSGSPHPQGNSGWELVPLPSTEAVTQFLLSIKNK